MSLRARLTVAAAAAVVVAIVVSSLLVYFATSHALVHQVDSGLRDRAAFILEHGGRFEEQPPGEALNSLQQQQRFGSVNGYAQVVTSAGTVLTGDGSQGQLPVSSQALALARQGGSPYFSSDHVDGVHVRVLTAAIRPGLVIQVARPLSEVDSLLGELRLVLIVVSAGAVVLAAAGAFVVARAVLRPVHHMTETAEQVAETRDLTQRIEVSGDDELARLARTFNTMLEALDDSLRAQRALVADASHELRTPLTSLRTNVEVLLRADELPAEDRAHLVRDIDSQIEELAALIGDVIELARGDEQPTFTVDVRLDEVVERTVRQAETHWPKVRFERELAPTVVMGVPERLARAIANLLDNAGKWSPDGGVVEVGLADRTLSVRDHGPGVSDEDAPHVFDRFWRARDARGMPGSGLGLAIVRQVATSHGASVAVERAEGGGARFVVRFPPEPAPDSTATEPEGATEREGAAGPHESADPAEGSGTAGRGEGEEVGVRGWRSLGGSRRPARPGEGADG